MVRPKKSSKVLIKAELRLAGMQSISESLDLGNGLSVEQFNSLILDLRAKLTTYNTALSTIDKARSEVLEVEQKLGDYSEHILLGVASRYGRSSNEYENILLGVASRYGRSSNEYEMAGGTRKDRRRNRRSPSSSA